MNWKELHDQLDHPIIDSDARWLEFGPLLQERIGEIAGHAVADCFTTGGHALPRAKKRVCATAMTPQLCRERMDELGLDFCVMHPADGIVATPNRSIRQQAARAFNTFCRDYFSAVADRMAPAAIIPLATLDEAVEELEHAVQELGFKVALFETMIEREAPTAKRGNEDSACNYDPLWSKCIELGVSPVFRCAADATAMGKALLPSGTTNRFPTLNMVFLEGLESLESGVSPDDSAADESDCMEDFHALSSNIYFGCTAENRQSSLPAERNTLFSSSHCDAADWAEALTQACQQAGEEDFKAFTFANPVHFWTSGNPHFFAGTTVEEAVKNC